MNKSEYYNLNKKLGKQEIKQLFREYKETGDKELREILIEEHLYIAEILAKKYLNRGIDYDDIFQVASIGLIYAIDRYDVDKGFEFSSFATPTIVGEIKKYFRDKVWTLRVPRRVQELSKKVSEAKLILEQKNKKHPKVKEIADYIGCSEEEVLESLEASYGYQPVSLDATTNSDSEENISLMDKIADKKESFREIEYRDFIEKFVATLNELELKIFKGRFYLEKTQSALAQELSISQMTISRLERKIIEKLKKEYEKNI